MKIDIYHGDFILKSKYVLEENQVDLFVTSPPYNLGIEYNECFDNEEYDSYLDFSERWLRLCYYYAKEDGRLCLNIPLDRNKNGIRPVFVDLVTVAKSVGWKYQSTIVWNEQNISRRTAWGSWMSASAPFVIAPVEVIVVMYKHQWKKQKKGYSDITRDEFIEWTNGVWAFSGEKRSKIGHPAPFPVELPKRCIKLFSYVGDLVCDPFIGSGTTAIAAIEFKRSLVGFDVDLEYLKIAKKRIYDKFGQVDFLNLRE